MAAIVPHNTGRSHASAEGGQPMLGNWIRLEQIGQGSFANVYRGKHVRSLHLLVHTIYDSFHCTSIITQVICKHN
jgi:hypothetical protein